jgi:hypothetical protein
MFVGQNQSKCNCKVCNLHDQIGLIFQNFIKLTLNLLMFLIKTAVFFNEKPGRFKLLKKPVSSLALNWNLCTHKIVLVGQLVKNDNLMSQLG